MFEGSFITSSRRFTEPGSPAPYFRREFTASRPMRATLWVTGLGIVELYLNGARVGDEVLAPGWTSYRHRVRVSRHDVTGLIRDGGNAVGAIVGEGWAVGRLGFQNRRNHYSSRPALWLRLVLDYGDHIDVIDTRQAFTTSWGAVLANGLYDGETYDARLEHEGWCLPGFDDHDWESATPLDWDLGTLVETSAPPIRRIEELEPVSITAHPSGTTIVDFGQNIAGWVQLTTTGEPGDTVRLRHAETLTAGELDTTTLRTAVATDRYILRGQGQERWEPRFTIHGFRYVEIDGPFDHVRAVVVHSDMTRTGWFHTSHEQLNLWHGNVVSSMRSNVVGLPTDCPQRDERLGWTGDINLFAPVATFLYDVRGVLGSWLADLAAEQHSKGYIPHHVPDVLAQPSPPTAVWSDAAVSLPWTLYWAYGDETILRDQYDSMATHVVDLDAQLDENDLWVGGRQFGDWLDPDAPADHPHGGKTDPQLVAAAFLCKTTREMAATATLLDTGDVAEFTALAQRVRAAFRREYLAPTSHIHNTTDTDTDACVETVTAYALAICFDLLDPHQEAHAGDRLAHLVATAGYRITTGYAGTPYVPEALTRTGHLEDAYRLMLQTECPSLLYPLTHGATTIWERWDAIQPDTTLHPSGMNSLNHAAPGAVASWLYRVVGGLTATTPGYRTMYIAPQPGGGLAHASLTHHTVHGEVQVNWKIVAGQVQLDVTIPDGTIATVAPPLHPDSLVEVIPPGQHQWLYLLPAAVTRS